MYVYRFGDREKIVENRLMTAFGANMKGKQLFWKIKIQKIVNLKRSISRLYEDFR